MHHIRPYRFFSLYEAPLAERIVNVPIPNRPGLGGLTLLETFLVLSAVRAIAAKRIFEFGTFLGRTTLALASNTPEDAQIFTLDLDDQTMKGLHQIPEEAPITAIHLASLANLDFSNSEARKKITTLFGDSTTFDFAVWANSIDFVFIDGGHEYATVCSDTENALNLLKPNSPACVMWHDYGNPDCAGLKGYLDKVGEEIEVFHIEGSWLCAHFRCFDTASALAG